MYSRKFGLRLRGKWGNLFKTADCPDVADWVICGTRIRSRFYVNESSFRLAACAPQSGKLTKAFGVTAAAERSPFLGDEPAFARLRRGRLSAGSLGCGNDLVEALVTAQRIQAWMELDQNW
jgi:hypothetical protein